MPCWNLSDPGRSQDLRGIVGRGLAPLFKEREEDKSGSGKNALSLTTSNSNTVAGK